MFIQWTFPNVPSYNNVMFMLENMTFKIAVATEKSIEPTDVIAEVWTNIYHKDNPEGNWHSIPLHIIESHENDNLIPADFRNVTFGNSVLLTSDGNYSFTFRVKQKPQGKTLSGLDGCRADYNGDWIWPSGFMQDGVVQVLPPSEDAKWSQGPNYDQILGIVHLGNFMAASVADELGFDAVLNLADTLDLIPSKFSEPIIYKKISLQDGAMHQIPDNDLQHAVSWLQNHAHTCKKILVNCRAGIGRAGSVVVAYVFAEDPSMTYKDAYDYVFARRFVYPHRGLEESLYRLYPRTTV